MRALRGYLGFRFMRNAQRSLVLGSGWKLSRVNGIALRERFFESTSLFACEFTENATDANRALALVMYVHHASTPDAATAPGTQISRPRLKDKPTERRGKP